MYPPFLICNFSKNTLGVLVRERFGDDFPNIINKRQVNYITNYLKDLGAKTILLESEYVDRDYLEDYSKYYVKCFNRYGERCARLHFFKREFDFCEFNEYLESSENKNIQNDYLGFIVLKPLPQTFIGKTCLKSYPRLSEKNKKVITKKYKVNLFGIDLSVDSVAFQEQDKVVSACATTAIWSNLHAQLNSDPKGIPACSEITLSAINHIVDSSNSFPNKGLTNKQILRAIDTQNYRNHKIDISEDLDVESFHSIIKTCISSNLPAILGVDVYSIHDNKLSKIGGHAVTVLGFSDEQNKAIYLHDDRVGPFARSRLRDVDEFNFENRDEIRLNWCLTIQNKNDSGEWCHEEEILVPDTILIPTHPKIRISFEDVENTCKAIIEELETIADIEIEDGEDSEDLKRPIEINEKSNKINFKVYLTETSDLKSKILQDKTILDKSDILTKCIARFLWVAEFTDEKNEKIFDIVFDATDIPQGNVVSAFIKYPHFTTDSIEDYFKEMHKKLTPDSNNSKYFFNAFIRSLVKKEPAYLTHLNEMYGKPCAPRTLRDTEIVDGRLQTPFILHTHYGQSEDSLDDTFPELRSGSSEKHKIWVIAVDGALLLGEEFSDTDDDKIEKRGHPTLTEFKPARIGGELRKIGKSWMINADSGRFSRNYTTAEIETYLQNALKKFKQVFPQNSNIEIQPAND